MSRSYDDRIVRMGFDNAKFESGARQTMSTLDKLNEKLKLKGAAEGSATIQKSVDSVDFSSMEKAIHNIEKRFSTLGVVSMNVINKITDGIAGSVARLEQATIGQIKSGGWARAMNIANAKFQIEGLGFAWEDVEKAVSYGVKDTAYGLDAAASAASQLAASGVDFKKTLDTVNGQEITAMHKSLRAISGVAAMTNSSYEDIARIFTTVAGNGRLMGDQLLQLSSRGMNAAAKLAEVMNTTEEDVRDMVSRGKIDFETFAFAMDNAFGDHAKEANKTFTGALGNMKAALSRVGEIFADPIINKTNTLFISLTTRIDEFKNKLKSVKVPRSLEEIKKQYDGISLSATAYEQILKGVGDKTVTLGSDFAAMWQSAIDAFSAMIKSIDLGWFDKIVAKVDETINKIKDFFDLIKEVYSDSAEEAADGVEDATKTLLVSAEEAQAAKDIILKGMYGSGQKRVDALTEMFGGGDIGAQHAKNVQAYVDSVVAAGWNFDKASIKVESASERIARSQTNVAKEVKKARIKAVIDDVKKVFSNLWRVTRNIGVAVQKITGSIFKAVSSVFKIDLTRMGKGVVNFSNLLVAFSKKLIISNNTAKKITDTFTVIFTKIKNGISYIKDATSNVKQFFNTVKENGIIKTIKNTISKVFSSIVDSFNGDGNSVFSVIKEKFSGVIDSIVTAFSESSLGDVFDDVRDHVKTFVDAFRESDGLFDLLDRLKDIEIPKLDSTKITDFVDSVVDSVKRLSLLDITNLVLGYKAVKLLIGLVDKLNKTSEISETAKKVPESVSKFFTAAGTSFNTIAKATAESTSWSSISTAVQKFAVSLGIIAASIAVLSFIKPERISKATAVCIIMMVLLTKMVTSLVKEGLTLSIAVGGAKGLLPIVASISLMLSSLSAALVKIAIAAKIIEKVPMEVIAGMIVVIYAFFELFGRLLSRMSTLNPKSSLAAAASMSIIMNAISAMVIAIGVAVAAIKNVKNLERILLPLFAFISVVTLLVYAFLKDTTDFGYSVTSKARALSMAVNSLAFAVLLIAASVRMVGDVKNIEQIVISLVGSLVLIMAAVWFFSERLADQKDYNIRKKILALTSSVLILSVSLNLIANAFRTAGRVKNLETTALTMMASLTAIVMMIGLFIKLTDKYDSSLRKRISAFTDGALKLAIALNLIAISFNTASKVKNIEATALTMVATLGAIALILGAYLECTDSYDSSITYRTRMLSVAFIAIGAAMLMISKSIKIAGDAKHIASGGLIMIGAILMIGEMLIHFNTMTKDDNASTTASKTLSFAVAFVAVAAAMQIIANALRTLDKLKNLKAAAITLGSLFAVIMLALGAFTYASGKSDFASGSVLAVAAAFMIVSVALAVLATSIEKLSGMENGLLAVAVSFGIFVAAIVILAALATALPKFSEGLTAVGKAFLYAGAGSALVGAGIFLVCEGIKVLAPAIGLLATNLGVFFTVIETHKAAATVGIIVLIALLAGVIIIIMKLSPVIEAIANTISAVAKKIGGTLDKGRTKLKNWVSNLSTKGKATIVALITTLCSAILAASPKILDTVGQLLIKLLAYLGKIAGDLAMGLLDFLINLINGLAEAIRTNSARIAAALWGVVISLLDLIMQIFGSLLSMIFSAIGWDSGAEWIDEHLKSASESMNEYASEQRRLAEEMDKSKRDYNEAIREQAKATEDSTSKSSSAFSGLTDVLRKEASEQSGIIDNLNDKYADGIPNNLAEYMQVTNSNIGSIGDTPLMLKPWGDTSVDSSSVPDVDQILSENGWGDEELAGVADEKATIFNDSAAESLDNPNEYNAAMTDNMKGVQKAIEDSEEPTVESVKKHINEAAKQALKEGRRGLYDGAEYCVDGAIEYIKKEGKQKYSSAMETLMKAGQNATEKTNEINSPSKVYYQYGEYIVQGLINGISQNTNGAVNSMTTLSDTVLAAFGNPFDYLSRIVNGDLVYDPSIRPVFDSSGLYRGASSINSMIGSQTISVAGLTGKLATDIGALDKSNLDVVNEIRALREDITTLGEEMAEMQIVMDTGALVGATVGPMDKALGAKSIRYRRG